MTSNVNTVLGRAAVFMDGHARTLERRLFDHAFRDGEPEAVVRAVAAHQNADGGFGHALEPDLRVSSSQPVFVHYGLTALREAGASARPLAERACAFLAPIANADGAIPYVLEDALNHARASHWQGDYALAPSLHATSGVIAGLHALGVEHEWLDRATAWCKRQIAGDPKYTGHTLLNVLDLVQNLPPSAETSALWERATSRLLEADHVQLETPITTYGLTPLHFAPTPASPLKKLFSDAVVDAHLDDLLARQREDGGWPLFWNPPAGAATDEWRGRWTLEALRTLRAYGRL
ncbi:MAG: hypothetical protein ACYTGZ_17875 [Planctomycetota bacterium]|jgi:hypothetical protein